MLLFISPSPSSQLRICKHWSSLEFVNTGPDLEGQPPTSRTPESGVRDVGGSVETRTYLPLKPKPAHLGYPKLNAEMGWFGL